MSDDHGDEYDEDGEDIDPAPAKGSWWILIVSGVAALLILVSAALVIGLRLRDANRVAAENAAGPGHPPPTGSDVHVVASPCPKCTHSIAAVDGLTWADRLPQPVTLTPDGQNTSARGELRLGDAQVFILTYYASTYLVSAQCRAHTDGGAPLTQAALDFLKGCVTATIPQNDAAVLSATRNWLEARFRPADARRPQVGWVCGQLEVDFVIDRRSADVVISGRQFATDQSMDPIMSNLDDCREQPA